MSIPNATLMKPLAWQDAALAPLLDDLQANILKGHGRPHSQHVFFRFDADHRPAIRDALAALPITSASAQLEATRQRHLDGSDGGTVVLLLISHSGYDALGVTPARAPGDPAFTAGMADASFDDAGTWDAPFRERIDAMLLVAHSDPTTAADTAVDLAATLVNAGAKEIAREIGTALFRDGQGIEHFGYVDGRSQPLMLQDEIDRERADQGAPFVWDPRFGPLEIALVPDPGGASGDSYGSYLVFRKLEQNVARFHQMEDKLAGDLNFVTPDQKPLAGAMIVGRFRDGTPVTASKQALGAPHVANNFVFASDQSGARCPFQGHIRKTNPRGDSGAAQERLHLMARRGIPYGQRAPDLSDEPDGGVGLLFMAYNRDIGNQFAFTQSLWANNAGFARTGTGRDPVIGSGPAGHRWRQVWDDPTSAVIASDIDECVTMKGGEYFFAPSLSFITGLAHRAD